MVKDITNSIKATLYERINNPLYGTFIFTWVVYNWEISLPLIFGSKKLEDKLIDVKTVLYASEGTFDWSTALIPLFSTIILLVFTPLIQRASYVYNEWNKSEGLKKRDKFTSQTMLTLEQSNNLRASIDKLQQNNQENLLNKDNEIQSYKKLTDEKTSELIELRSKHDEIKAELRVLNKLKTELSQIKKLTETQLNTIKLLTFILPHYIVYDAREKQIDRTETLFNTKNWKILLECSTEPQWKSMIPQLMVQCFMEESTSMKAADELFDTLIRPFLSKFNRKDLEDIMELCRYGNNKSISKRGRAEEDYNIVKNVYESLLKQETKNNDDSVFIPLKDQAQEKTNEKTSKLTAFHIKNNLMNWKQTCIVSICLIFLVVRI